MPRLFPLLLLMLLLATHATAAPIVNAAAAESAFQQGDYKAARSGFDSSLEQFLAKAPRDGTEHLVYREAEYLLDRLADCSFTQRDWPRLKQYMDSQWRMVNQDITVCEQQLIGTVQSEGAVHSVAQYVATQLDEAMRLRQIFQLKRSLALLLVDSNGSGPRAEKAIRLYQQLALALRKVVSVEDGALKMDLRKLSEAQIAEFEAINAELPEREMRPLWEKYKPELPETRSGTKPAKPAGKPKGDAANPKPKSSAKP
jgi:hypothetical protein